MIYDKKGFVFIEAILFLGIVTLFMTMLLSIVQTFPDEFEVYEKMFDNDSIEVVYHE